MASPTQPSIEQMMAELRQQAVGPKEPFDPIGTARRNLAGMAEKVGAIPGNLKRMVTDPVAYAKSLPAPTGEQIMNAMGPGNVGMAGVIKPKGGNWLGGNLMGSMDRNVQRMQPYVNVGDRLAASEAQLASMKNAGGFSERTLQGQQNELNRYKGQQAINDWVKNNLGNYAKKQMGTPEDPVRALHEQGITHLGGQMDELSAAADSSLRGRRTAAGYPAEGMGQSEMARKWENLTDDAIASMRAGDVQATSGALEQSRAVLQALRDKEAAIQQKFNEHVLSKGLSEKDLAAFNNMPMKEKAAIIQDPEYQGLANEYQKHRMATTSAEYEAGQQNPWVAKVAPETELYSGHASGLGFDHVIDVLKQDVAEGRIRPEQLNKISMEQAVRRTHEYDQAMAAKMAEASAKEMSQFPVHKEYPEGYKWYELRRPDPQLPEGAQVKYLPEVDMWGIYDNEGGTLSSGATKQEAINLYKRQEREAALEQALKNEGEQMGHCVGGYCPDVLEGKSRIYSLRGPKGESHVTVETEPTGRGMLSGEDLNRMEPGLFDKYLAQRNMEGGTDSLHQWLASTRPELANQERIVQIKGKQNAAPIEKYLPYVQDFVKSGKWSDVGDIHNTGLRQSSDVFNPTELQTLQGKGHEVGPYLTPQEIEQLQSTFKPSGMARGGKVSMVKGDDAHALDAMKLESCGCNIQHKATGGQVLSIEQMKAQMMAKKTPVGLSQLQSVGANEAPSLGVKAYIPPTGRPDNGVMPVGGVDTSQGNLPIGGIDMSRMAPGQQLMPQNNMQPAPQQPPQGLPGAPGQPPMGAAPGGAPAPSGGSNILQMTPQGQAMAAMSGGQQQPPQQPQGLAKGGQPKGYVPHTPSKPHPDVGSRFEATPQGNLAPRQQFDIAQHEGKGSIVPIPYDATTRDQLVTGVSGHALQNPLLTEGGFDYSLDKGNMAQNIGGASNLGIAGRVQKRIDQAAKENAGNVFLMPNTMSEDAENFSHHPASIVLDLLQQRQLNKKTMKALSDDLRSQFEVKKTPNGPVKIYPYKNFLGYDHPELMDQVRFGGRGLGTTAGNLRKKMMERLGQVNVQRLLNYNLGDVKGAILDPSLATDPKAYMGHTVVKAQPGAPLRLSKHGSYDTDYAGTNVGGMGNRPLEILMPDVYSDIEKELLQRPAKVVKTPAQHRAQVVGALEKRKEKFAQPINARVINNAGLYQEGLQQGEFDPKNVDSVLAYFKRKGGYKKGGGVKLHTDQDTMALELSRKSKKAK